MYYTDRLCLVTGGTGFVGTHIVSRLLDEGARVRIPVHERGPLVDDPRIETVAADLTRPEDCLRAMDGVECVFHAAGAVSAAGVTAGRNPLGPIATNLTLTARVLEAAWTASVDRILVFGSSTGYPAASHPVHEDEMWNGPTHPAYFGYGWSRRYTERMAEFVAERSSVKVAVCRPTAVYGPHDNFDPATSHVIPALIRKAVERMDPFEVWGTGDEVRDNLHVDDLARGCLLLLEKHATCDPVNIGYGRGCTVRDMVGMILRAAGYVDARVQFDPSAPTTIPIRLVDTGKARRVLGFEPRFDLEAGLADTVEWYRRSRAA